MGLLQIPEETSPPAIALQARACQEALAPEVLRQEAIARLASNASLRRLHRELLQIQPISLETRFSPNFAVGRTKLEDSGSLPEFLAVLKPAEKAAVLSDPDSLTLLETLLPQDIQEQRAGGAPAARLE
jgi:membrane glycosyltransferase